MDKLKEEGVIESCEVHAVMSNHDATTKDGYNKPFYHCVAKTLQLIKTKLREDSNVLVLPVAEPYLIACLAELIGSQGRLTVLHDSWMTFDMLAEYQHTVGSAVVNNLTIHDHLSDDVMFDVILAGNVDTVPQVLLRRLKFNGRLVVCCNLEDLTFDKDDQGFVTKQIAGNGGVLDYVTFHVPQTMMEHMKFSNVSVRDSSR